MIYLRLGLPWTVLSKQRICIMMNTVVPTDMKTLRWLSRNFCKVKAASFHEIHPLLAHWCSRDDLFESISFEKLHVNCFLCDQMIVLQESRTGLLLDSAPIKGYDLSLSIERFVLHYHTFHIQLKKVHLIGGAAIALSQKSQGPLNNPLQGSVPLCIKGKAKAFDQFCGSKERSGFSLNPTVWGDRYNLRLLHKGIQTDSILAVKEWFLCYVKYPLCFPICYRNMDLVLFFKQYVGEIAPDLKDSRRTWTLYPPSLFFVNTLVILKMVYALYTTANPAALARSTFKIIFRCYTEDPKSGQTDCKYLGGPYLIDPENFNESESQFLRLIKKAINLFVHYYPGLMIKSIICEVYYMDAVQPPNSKAGRGRIN
jgi:hypothetical protein